MDGFENGDRVFLDDADAGYPEGTVKAVDGEFVTVAWDTGDETEVGDERLWRVNDGENA